MTNILLSHPHISFQSNWRISGNTLFMLGQCEAIIRMISSAPLEPEYRKKLLRVSLRKGAQATTAIEGNTLSDEEIAKIDEGGKLPPSKEYLQTEVQNVIDALNQIRHEVVLDGKEHLITPDLIKSFHYNIGKNLGDHLRAAPGQFRRAGEDVIVGSYKPPLGKDVADLVMQLCQWLRDTFQYEKGKQSFTEQVFQAIVCHVYIAWIHPFGDGNGRTARLIEFYLLLRAGLPDIASHILSNHYNNTREEYYRQLDGAGKEQNLSRFIEYAVLGFRDGLNEVLGVVQSNVLKTAWRNYIYEILDSKKAAGKTKAIVKRRRNVALHFPTDSFQPIDYLLRNNPEFIREYAKYSPLTLKRDLMELEKLGLIVADKGKYKANIEILKESMPLKKEKNKAD
ncbi:MAG TPA: Fic family protein [Smithellaceae bacterium]|nr:Fic family protein [Smithellaceae bacterium]